MHDGVFVAWQRSLLVLRLNVHALSLKVVGRLANVHPVAWQLELVKCFFVSHDGENFTLDRSWTILDSIDHIKGEDVETRVDLVADVDLGLLDKAFDLTVLLGNDDSIARRVLDLGHHNSSLLAVALVVADELVKRVLANHI